MKWVKLIPVLVLLLLGTGCSTRELEDRGFPLAIGIDKNEEGMVLSFDFPNLTEVSDGKNPSGKPVSFSVEAGAYYEAQKAYENNTNKVLDYNHLKAIIIGQEFLADQAAMRELFAWLEREEVVARNTCLFVAQKQASEILTLTEQTGGSMGKYLEQMVETQQDFKENKIMTIGKLMNQWHNQNELLLIPVLSDNGGVPSVTEYAVVDAFSYCGNITVEAAMKAFLCQGMLKSFLYRLTGGEVVEIQNICTKAEIVEKEETIEVQITLTGNAQLKKAGEDGELTEGQLKRRLEQQLTQTLTRTGAELLQEPGVDISNSFILLGGYARNLYEQYHQDYEGYQNRLELKFFVNMSLLNE